MVTREYARMTASIRDINSRIDPLGECDTFRGLVTTSGATASPALD